jgi:hypothetical protein
VLGVLGAGDDVGAAEEGVWTGKGVGWTFLVVLEEM